MKKYIFLFVFGMFCATISAQETMESKVRVGDLYTIGTEPATGYSNIKVPKANMIIKRGGIAHYDKLAKTTVRVSSISQDRDGRTVINITRADDGRFFGSHTSLTVAYEKALQSGELISL